jgi:hypothetical protein
MAESKTKTPFEQVTGAKTPVSPTKKPVESKRDRFRRLAPKRVTQAIKKIGYIRNLSTRASYEYTADEAAKIVHALKTSVALVEQAFAGREEQSTGFSL